ncbi:MAG: NADH-quinone oxidoreductase subunit M [Armatimonadetes bacterium]|nr:NADH-quinone oxidoreductase subunit M [Armatimonadota bacterium]
MNFPYLTVILSLPAIALLCVLLTPKEKENQVRGIAAFFTFLTMVLSIHVYRMFLALPAADKATWQLVERHPWFKDLGIAYIVGIDGLNAPMLLLAGILAFTATLVSFNIKTRVKEYFCLALASMTGVFGIFVSLDLFFFILFYEMASVPMYFLVGMWGTVPKTGARMSLDAAATKLMIYLQMAGGIALVGILGLYFNVEPHTFDLTQIMASIGQNPLPETVTRWLFPVIFLAFAVEAGFFPFHTWLPDGHSSAPTALSMLLAGVLLKMGGYGCLRLGIATMPEAAAKYMPFFMALAVVNVLYGALCALKQVDIKYFIAYSSVSHMGIVILGLGTFNVMGLQGAVYQMFSHGIITALLFAMAGYIYEKTHTRNLDEMGGLAIRMPYLAAIFAMGGLASLGLPGMSGFVAELMVFFGLFAKASTHTLGILSILGLVITATYILRAVQKIFFGPLNEHYAQLPDAVGVEHYPLAILAATMVLFGCWPALLIDAMAPSVASIVQVFAPIVGGQ